MAGVARLIRDHSLRKDGSGDVVITGNGSEAKPGLERT
jgi:hypothetical protein